MNLQPDGLYHIYNRGNNRDHIFFNDENYRYFLGKMRKHLLPHCHLLAWCLMPNHFHWLVLLRDTANALALGKDLRVMLSSYTRAIQQQQQHTQAKELTTEGYALNCFCYLHQNPLHAGLEATAGEWVWSSFWDYAGLRSGNLCDRALAQQLLDLPAGATERQALLLQALPEDVGKVRL